MAEEVPRVMKNQASKRQSSNHKGQSSTEQNKRGRSSVPMPPPAPSNVWVCNNPACRARQSTAPSFCKRCSCCICRQYDDNKDPSLWLECIPDSGSEGSCGFSCHIECALRHGKVGVNSTQLQLDGSYCCASCGEVSSVIGFWKKQLKIAMEAHRIDVLCYRIFLSYRLLHGSFRYQELQRPIEDLKAQLEIELGPINEAAAQLSRGHAGRIHAANHVQTLCKLALQKSEERPTSSSGPVLNLNEGSVPPPDAHHTALVVFDKEKQLPESCSEADTLKSDAVGDVPPEAARLSLPDLNEDLGQPNLTPLIDNDGPSCTMEDNFENIVKIVRGLEQGGHISKEFRLKFLTWYGLRSGERERKVVGAFVNTMNDVPSGLADQLIDTFSDIIFGRS